MLESKGRCLKTGQRRSLPADPLIETTMRVSPIATSNSLARLITVKLKGKIKTCVLTCIKLSRQSLQTTEYYQFKTCHHNTPSNFNDVLTQIARHYLSISHAKLPRVKFNVAVSVEVEDNLSEASICCRRELTVHIQFWYKRLRSKQG